MQNIGILKINETAEKNPSCIRFDKGSAKFPFPEEFFPLLEKVKKKIKGRYFHYPKTGGEDKLKEQIVKFEAQNGRQISPRNITITHGGMSGLFAFFYLLLKTGDEVITSRYCFEGFSLLIDHFKLFQKRVDLSKIGDIEKAVTSKTKAIILNSPENPTGKVYSQEEIEKIVDLAKKRKLWVLSDEVMNRIVYEGAERYEPSFEGQVVVVNSFSKMWFIPGIRVGWLVTKKEKLSEEFSNFISIQSIGVNLFSQLLMAEILEKIDFEKFLERRLKTLFQRKKIFEQNLKENEIDYLSRVEGGMNFYVNLRQDAAKLASKILKEGKVAFIPGVLFEGRPSTYARFGFGGVTEEGIIRGIKIVSNFL